MTTLRSLRLAAATLAAFAPFTMAQDKPSPAPQKPTPSAQPTAPAQQPANQQADADDDLVGSDTLLGSPIVSDSGATLGTVDDVLVDSSTGRLMAVVVAPAPSLRPDGQLVTVPADSLQLAPAQAGAAATTARALRLAGVTEDKLRSAPGFAKDKWPDPADGGWMKRMRSHFGGTAPADEAGVQPERLSVLVGRDVQDSQRAAIGRISSVAVDLRERELAMALVDPVPELGPAGRQMAVPYAALREADPAVSTNNGAGGDIASQRAAHARRAFGIDMARERLAAAPRVERGDMARLRALRRSNEADDFFGVLARRRFNVNKPEANKPDANKPEADRPAQPERPRSEPDRPKSDQPERPRGEQGGTQGGGGPRGT